jgi:hydroxyacylglutathione hydrolase
MLFQQFEAKGLSHYSYAVGSKETSEVAIVDPERDIQTYIQYAADNRLKIKYILETHIHADYASGAKELADKTGAQLCLSSYDTGQTFEYQFPHQELKDGDVISMGNVHLKVLHTPGHTPEHISFLVFDDNRSKEEALSMLSGDFLFIGSVGRPDLLGEEDKIPLAKSLYRSVTEKLKDLHDGLEVYPGHGAGSLCGAGLGSGNHTTLGYEREANPYLQPMSEDAFVKKILSNVPPFPEYYVRMKGLNSKGAKALDGLPKPAPITPEDFVSIVDKGELIVDVREALAFGGGHIENSINIGMPDQLGFWGAWFIPYEKPFYLVVDSESKVPEYVRALVRVGLDDVKGYLKPGFSSWANRGNDFVDLPQASVHFLNDLIEMGEELSIIDVRSESEWNSGHIDIAKHVYLGEIAKQAKKLNLNKEKPVFCICGGGSRSSVAGSILKRNGFEQVYNVFGGMSAWKGAKLPVVAKKEKEAVA